MPYRAVDVHRVAASAADEVVVVVIDPVLVAGRRTCRLDTPDQAAIGQNAQGVVHRLTGDCADLTAYHLFDLVSRPVGPAGHGAEHGQTLRRHLYAPLAKEGGRAGGYFPEHEFDSYSNSGLCQVFGPPGVGGATGAEPSAPAGCRRGLVG